MNNILAYTEVFFCEGITEHICKVKGEKFIYYSATFGVEVCYTGHDYVEGKIFADMLELNPSQYLLMRCKDGVTRIIFCDLQISKLFGGRVPEITVELERRK